MITHLISIEIAIKRAYTISNIRIIAVSSSIIISILENTDGISQQCLGVTRVRWPERHGWSSESSRGLAGDVGSRVWGLNGVDRPGSVHIFWPFPTVVVNYGVPNLRNWKITKQLLHLINTHERSPQTFQFRIKSWKRRGIHAYSGGQVIRTQIISQ